MKHNTQKATRTAEAQVGTGAIRIPQEILGLMETTANMLRGVTLDPAIPKHAKDAMWASIHKLETAVEAAIEYQKVVDAEICMKGRSGLAYDCARAIRGQS